MVVVVKPFHASEFSFIVSLSSLVLLCCPLFLSPLYSLFLPPSPPPGFVVFPWRGGTPGVSQSGMGSRRGQDITRAGKGPGLGLWLGLGILVLLEPGAPRALPSHNSVF